MVTVIKKGASAKVVKQKLEKHAGAVKKNDLRKYCGVISLKKDPVELQINGGISGNSLLLDTNIIL